MSFYTKNTNQISTEKIEQQTLLNYFNEFAQVVSGINEIISPEAQNEKENETEITNQKSNRNWNIFIGITILATIILTGYLIIKK